MRTRLSEFVAEAGIPHFRVGQKKIYLCVHGSLCLFVLPGAIPPLLSEARVLTVIAMLQPQLQDRAGSHALSPADICEIHRSATHEQIRHARLHVASVRRTGFDRSLIRRAAACPSIRPRCGYTQAERASAASSQEDDDRDG